MQPREVKYVRWKAWVNTGLGAALTLASLLGAWYREQAALLLITFVGAVLTHIARLPLLEPDVLLRLTPTRIWTKELGWRRWAEVQVYVEKNRRQRRSAGGHLVIHRPGECTPRFFENLGALDITERELTSWLAQFAGKG